MSADRPIVFHVIMALIFQQGELIAASKTVEELRDFLGLDTLYYLSLEGLLESTGIKNPESHFCKACFDGCYPVDFDEDMSKDCLERR